MSKTSAIQFALRNKGSREYLCSDWYTTSNVVSAGKFHSYLRALEEAKKLEAPDEWEILKVETTCEIKEICS